MINILIERQASLPTINVRFGDSVSANELRSTWEDVSSGVLERHIRAAIVIECARRGIEPSEVVPDEPADSD